MPYTSAVLVLPLSLSISRETRSCFSLCHKRKPRVTQKCHGCWRRRAVSAADAGKNHRASRRKARFAWQTWPLSTARVVCAKGEPGEPSPEVNGWLHQTRDVIRLKSHLPGRKSGTGRKGRHLPAVMSSISAPRPGDCHKPPGNFTNLFIFHRTSFICNQNCIKKLL